MAKTPIEIMLDAIEWKSIEREGNIEGDLPYATHEGVLVIGGMSLRVYQLNTGERVIEEDDLVKFFDTGEG